jgi:hypothetical protein
MVYYGTYAAVAIVAKPVFVHAVVPSGYVLMSEIMLPEWVTG